jgi:hypothetical protein
MIKPRRRMRWVGHVERMGVNKNVRAYSVLVGKLQGKRSIGRPRHRWEDIRMNLREIRWSGMDWIDLAQDWGQWRALVNTVVNLRVPLNVQKFLSS